MFKFDDLMVSSMLLNKVIYINTKFLIPLAETSPMKV